MKLSKILTRHAHWICRHPFPVIVFTLVVTGVMAWFASHLKGNFNILNLLPANAPHVIQLRELLDEFGGEDRLLMAMEPCRKGCDVCSAYRDRLLAVVRERDHVREEPFFKNLKGFATDDRDWMLEFIFDNVNPL